MKTDPNSIYRQVFNRDLKFFLYVIDNSELPIHMKLHVQTQSPGELSDSAVKLSLLKTIQKQEFGYWTSAEIATEVKQFPRKNQIKVFLKVFKEKDKAKKLFSFLYKS